MSNVTALANLRNTISYLPDGVRQVADAIGRFLPLDVISSDGAGWFAFPAISVTKQEISATGKRPLAVIIRSNGTTSYVHFHNAAAASVTEGVNADMVLPCSSTAAELSTFAFFGASWPRFWGTGLTVSASSTQETSAAPAVPPDVWVLFG